MMTEAPQNQVNNNKQDAVVGLIFKLREMGLTYAQIGSGTNIHRSYLFQMFKRQAFPKKLDLQQKYLDALNKFYGEKIKKEV